MLNRVILIGRLAADPELRYTPSGAPVATFAIAVNRALSAEARAQGQPEETDFIDLVCWRNNAEFAANYLTKGRLVAVEGRLQIRRYVTKDGQQRKAAEVIVDSLKPLDRPKEAVEGEGQSEQPTPVRGAVPPSTAPRAEAPAMTRPPAKPTRPTTAPPVDADPFDDSGSESDPFAE